LENDELYRPSYRLGFTEYY